MKVTYKQTVLLACEKGLVISQTMGYKTYVSQLVLIPSDDSKRDPVRHCLEYSKLVYRCIACLHLK